MSPFHHHGRGQRDGLTPLLRPSWCCWIFSGCAACCIMPGPAVTPQTSRDHPSACHHPASALGSRSPFLASPTSPTARPVRRQLCRAHRRPAPPTPHRLHAWPPASGGHVGALLPLPRL